MGKGHQRDCGGTINKKGKLKWKEKLPGKIMMRTN